MNRHISIAHITALVTRDVKKAERLYPWVVCAIPVLLPELEDMLVFLVDNAQT
jgi:hypothetical protein